MLRLLRIPEGFLTKDDDGHVVLRFSDRCNGSEPRHLEDLFDDLIGKRVLISVKSDEQDGYRDEASAR